MSSRKGRSESERPEKKGKKKRVKAKEMMRARARG